MPRVVAAEGRNRGQSGTVISTFPTLSSARVSEPSGSVRNTSAWIWPSPPSVNVLRPDAEGHRLAAKTSDRRPAVLRHVETHAAVQRDAAAVLGNAARGDIHRRESR